MKFKRSVFLAIFVLSTNLFTFANDIFKINLETDFGFMEGSISELVYEDIIKNTDHLESQLNWDVKNIPYFEANLNLTIIDYIFAEVNGRFAIPSESGSMQDYDWLNSVTSMWKNDDPTELTNYSHHDNFLDEFYRLRLSLGGNFSIGKKITLIPLLTYEYELSSFSGFNGYKTYKSDNWIESTFEGRVISYKQEYNSFMLGLKADFTPFNHLRINGSFYYSPMLTILNAIDYHYLKGSAYWDNMNNASILQGDLGVLYSFNKMHSLGVKGGLQYIPKVAGNDYIRAINSEGKYTSKNWGKAAGAEGGTSRIIWDISLSYILSF